MTEFINSYVFDGQPVDKNFSKEFHLRFDRDFSVFTSLVKPTFLFFKAHPLNKK